LTDRAVTTVTGFRDHLAEVAGEVEETLDSLLSPGPGLAPGEPRLWEAMRYATLGGGKRLRAYLAVEAAAMFGIDRASGLRAGAAVECVHAYSLVHDDLPAMDDDALRRGKPTAHRAFDEATAILAGDALQALAFEILADPATHTDPAVRAELCLGLARAAGAPGMVGGQMVDIAAETAAEPFGLATITRLQALKTGALIRFSAEAGAILGGDEQDRARLGDYAGHLGLAFQIRDDLLDVEGDPEAVGKGVGKDAKAGKATFVSELGLAGAREAAEVEVAAAIAALGPFGPRARRLREAAEFAIQRVS
jgi:farnesyl diphosphate synthase